MKTCRLGSVPIAIAASFIMFGAMRPALAVVRIADDYGGRIGDYIQRYAELSRSGDRIEIDGDCFSACTLLLKYIPHDKACVTSRARLGFHAAWKPGFLGIATTNAAGTQLLLRSYPVSVRNWLAAHGGLTRQMLYLKGTRLEQFYPLCKK